MKIGSRRPGATRRRRLGIVMTAIGLLGAFGLTACEPTPAQTALKLTLTDTASSDAPAANVTVSVFPAADTSAPATANGITDANGNVWFTHSQLPAGDYQVMFGSPTFMIEGSAVPGSDNARWYDGSAADAATDRSGATTIGVTATDDTTMTESYAVPRGHLDHFLDHGALTDPLNGVTVTAYAWPSGKAVATTTSRDNGHYRFADLPAQNYKLGFTMAGWATFYAGYAQSRAASETAFTLADAREIPATRDMYYEPNYEHTMHPESTITGTVTDGTDPVSGEIVLAYVADTNHLATYTTTAVDGTFTLHGLSGIGYRLAFVTPGNTYAPMVLGAGTGPGVELDVANGSTFSLQTGGTLSLGTVSLTQGADCAAAQAASGTTADLGFSDLRNCDLATANLRDVDLAYANLAGANLSTATLPDFLLTSSPEMYGADLSNANLSHVESPSGGSTYVGGSDLSGADLSHADLTSVTLTGADLSGANLSHANLSHGAIDESNVSGADLSSATFSYTMTNDLSWSTPPTLPAGYKFVGSTLLGAGVGMSGVDLSGADLSGMDLSKLWLTTTNLSGADLSNATLTDITWNEVDLSGANLAGATLSVGYAGHLTHDENTVLPAGWDIVNGTFVHTSP